MYELAGKEDKNDFGCLFGMGIILLLTLASISPFLLPAISTTGWYVGLNTTTFVFLFLGLILIIFPLTSWRTKFLLLVILLGCILLQLSTMSLLSDSTNIFKLPASITVAVHIGFALLLLGLYIFTFIISVKQDYATQENITSSLSISEKRVTLGKAFLIRYHLIFKKTTHVGRLSISFSYQQYANYSLSQGGYPGYEEQTLSIFEKRDFLLEAAEPFVHETNWTIPSSLIPEDGKRKD